MLYCSDVLRKTFAVSVVFLHFLLTSHVVRSQASITALAPLQVNRKAWTITADSFNPGNNVSFAIDGTTNTFWQSQRTGSTPRLPHNVIIDMKNQYLVNAYSYLPRQDGKTAGNIGQHTIALSTDGINWTTVATGTWPNDKYLKMTYFGALPARYVRLLAKSEASNTGKQFSSAADLNVFVAPQAAVPRANWVVTADSEENVIAQSYNATAAIDGEITTFWQTRISGGVAPLPHYFNIDQGSPVTVGGLSYLPRPPSTSPNGTIGDYRVDSSTDGSNWTPVISGTWSDDFTLKTIAFPAISSRYFRLVALTEAGKRGQYASASNINLLDGNTQLTDFTVTVDSQEIIKANRSGLQAMDGLPLTFWQTAWSTTPVPGFPHYFTIDMQNQFAVHALTYLPRQDGQRAGNIGAHQIDVSTDGSTWTKVAKGTFVDNQSQKVVNFKQVIARYVRLTANSEAGNRGPWSSAAEISLSFDSSYTAPPSSIGQWGQTIDFPTVPVAAVLMYNTSKIVGWSSYSPVTYVGTGKTYTAEYDPSTGLVSQEIITNTGHDMFCPGLSLDFNGRPFVTGGDDAAKLSIYDPPSDTWFSGPNMLTPRGYQAQQTLSDGRIFTIGGSWSGGRGGKNGEVFNITSNAWTRLPGCLVAAMLTNDTAGVYRADNHGWIFAWSNATVFQAGPSSNMNWYSTTGSGGTVSAGKRASNPDSMNGNAVMYDAVAGKILTVGGSPSYQNSPANSQAHILTITTPNSPVSAVRINDMNYRRAFANSVILPDGTVFIVGGQEWPLPFTDDDAILTPELWDPVTQQFTLLAPMVTARAYHSVALLQPDGTVFSGGGGLCNGCSTNHFDAQIYSPPYLFNGPQPVILSISSSAVTVGGSLTIGTDSPCTNFSMVRVGTATHTVDTDQRRIPLVPITNGTALNSTTATNTTTTTAAAATTTPPYANVTAPYANTTTTTTNPPSNGTNSYTFAIPSDPGIALPGYWMLFAMNSAGVPSIAKFVQVQPSS